LTSVIFGSLMLSQSAIGFFAGTGVMLTPERHADVLCYLFVVLTALSSSPLENSH
jgi:hypothetical protein